MQHEVLLPQVELTMESVVIARWLVHLGDHVNEQQPILEVETQKAVSEVPSPLDGYVRQLCVVEGDTVGEKALLCVLTDTADEPLVTAVSGSTVRDELLPQRVPLSIEPSGNGNGDGVKASPVARRIARELSIDLSRITGTGPGGRITESDVRASSANISSTDGGASDWRPLPAARVALIAQMQKSLAEIPQICIRRQIDVSPLMQTCDGVSFTHRLAKAVAATLVSHPALRTIFDSNRTHVEPVSVAIAMDTPHGLVAPVVRNADHLSLPQISAAIRELRAKAESNTLRRSELTDAPFAISNLGMFGVDQFDGFVFHGQTAVLSVGRSTDSDSNRKLAWFGLAVDHRIVDGAEAARFLETLQTEISSSIPAAVKKRYAPHTCEERR